MAVFVGGQWITDVSASDLSRHKIPIHLSPGELPADYRIEVASIEQSKKLGGAKFVAVRRSFEVKPDAWEE